MSLLRIARGRKLIHRFTVYIDDTIHTILEWHGYLCSEVRQDGKKAAEFCIISTTAELFMNAMSFVSGPFAASTQQVWRDGHDGRPLINTSMLYDGKVYEFTYFCMARHPSHRKVDDYSTIGTEEKLFGFLLYQSRRPPRSLMGRKNKTKQTPYREDEEQEVLVETP